MRRTKGLALFSAAALLAACADPGGAPEAPVATPPPAVQAVPSPDRSWTGLTQPEAVIAARRALMQETERLMKPVDSFIVGEASDPELLRDNATAMVPMLLALPHLFPPTTNRFDPSAEDPLTIALPTIWQRFAVFQTFAESAERAAAALRDATGDPGELEAASTRLRGACDACHGAFMKPYTPPLATDEDVNFDFDSILPPQ